jgi:hypothetical protein
VKVITLQQDWSRQEQSEQCFRLPDLHPPRVVKVQCGNRCPSDRSDWHHPVVLPTEMVTPLVAARIEKRNDVPGLRGRWLRRGRICEGCILGKPRRGSTAPSCRLWIAERRVRRGRSNPAAPGACRSTRSEPRRASRLLAECRRPDSLRDAPKKLECARAGERQGLTDLDQALEFFAFFLR